MTSLQHQRRIVYLELLRRPEAHLDDRGHQVQCNGPDDCPCDVFAACCMHLQPPPQPAPPVPPLSLSEIYNNRGFTGGMRTVTQKDWL